MSWSEHIWNIKYSLILCRVLPFRKRSSQHIMYSKRSLSLTVAMDFSADGHLPIPHYLPWAVRHEWIASLITCFMDLQVGWWIHITHMCRRVDPLPMLGINSHPTINPYGNVYYLSIRKVTYCDVLWYVMIYYGLYVITWYCNIWYWSEKQDHVLKRNSLISHWNITKI